MTRINKLVFAVVLVSFLLNTAIVDSSFALAPQSIFDNITRDATAEDLARAEKFVGLCAAAARDDVTGRIDLGRLAADVKFQDSIFRAKVEPYFNEPEAFSPYHTAYKCRVGGSRRLYHVIIPIRTDDEVPVVYAFTENEYRKVKAKVAEGGLRPLREDEKGYGETGAEAMRRYKEEGEKIDEWIAERIEEGNFTEIDGRAEELGWDGLYPNRTKPSAYFRKTILDDIYREIRSLVAKGGLNLAKEPFTGKNIVFIRVPENVACPKIHVKDPDTGNEADVMVWSHISQNAVYKFLDESVFDRLMREDRVDETSVQGTLVSRNILHELFHEAGVEVNLPYTLEVEESGAGRVVNAFDKLLGAVRSSSYKNRQNAAIKKVKTDYPVLSQALKPVDLDTILDRRDYAMGAAAEIGRLIKERRNTPVRLLNKWALSLETAAPVVGGEGAGKDAEELAHRARTLGLYRRVSKPTAAAVKTPAATRTYGAGFLTLLLRDINLYLNDANWHTKYICLSVDPDDEDGACLDIRRGYSDSGLGGSETILVEDDLYDRACRFATNMRRHGVESMQFTPDIIRDSSLRRELINVLGNDSRIIGLINKLPHPRGERELDKFLKSRWMIPQISERLVVSVGVTESTSKGHIVRGIIIDDARGKRSIERLDLTDVAAEPAKTAPVVGGEGAGKDAEELARRSALQSLLAEGKFAKVVTMLKEALAEIAGLEIQGSSVDQSEPAALKTKLSDVCAFIARSGFAEEFMEYMGSDMAPIQIPEVIRIQEEFWPRPVTLPKNLADIQRAAIASGVGRKIAETVGKINLVIPKEFAEPEEIAKHEALLGFNYGSRFNVEHFSGMTASADSMMANMSGKIKSGDEKKTVVLVPTRAGGFTDSQSALLNGLKKNGVQLVFVDEGSVKRDNIDDPAGRLRFQINTFAIMALARYADNEKTAGDPLVQAALRYYLKSCFNLNGISAPDYITALAGTDITRLIKAVLSYSQFKQYKADGEDHLTVSKSLVFA